MSECAYCGREALSKDRNCYGCGAPVRKQGRYRPYSYQCVSVAQSVGTDLACTAIVRASPFLSKERYETDYD